MPAESPTLVVNENDEPSGVQRRDYIQRNGLWHRIVGVWIVDEVTGDMLVQKRQYGRGLDDGKLDSSASGHVDPGEDFIDTAVREVREEIGVRLDKDQLVQIAYFRTENTNGDKTLNRFTKVFIARLGKEAIELSIDSKELGDVEWLSAGKVTDLVTKHQDQTVPGFVIAWYLHNGLPIPDGVVAENNVVVIESLKEA
jgi:8-oxo-dGTP diphosphatase